MSAALSLARAAPRALDDADIRAIAVAYVLMVGFGQVLDAETRALVAEAGERFLSFGREAVLDSVTLARVRAAATLLEQAEEQAPRRPREPAPFPVARLLAAFSNIRRPEHA